jgi:hypothetical protein
MPGRVWTGETPELAKIMTFRLWFSRLDKVIPGTLEIYVNLPKRVAGSIGPDERP